MTKPSSRLRPFPQRHRLFATLLTCCLAAGCQTPGFSTAFSGKDTPAKAASSTDTASPAGLPEPTNTASSNSPLSLSSIEEHLRLGEEELTRGNLQQAQLHFDHVIEKHPDHAKAHHRLGVLADKMNHFEQAEQHYLTALAADPHNAPLLSDLGYSYYMQGRHSDAERYLLQSRKVDPAYDTAIANLGLLYGSTGRKQEALALFRQIGDDEQVREIMQQIDKGEFGSSGQLADSEPTSQQTSVVTTQTSVQQSSAAGERWAQQDPAGDLAAQLQKARDELRRAEEQLAGHQQMQAAAQPQAMPPSYDSHLAQAAWSQQSAQQAAAPQAWSQQPSQQQLPQSQSMGPGVNQAPAGFDAQASSAPLPVVTPGQRQQPSQAEANAAAGSYADPAATRLASADPAQPPHAAAGPAGAAAMQGSPGQPSGGPPAAAALSHPVPSHDQFAAGGNTASPPPAAWGRQFETTNQQAAAQNGPNTSSGIQQLNGTTSSFDQRQPVEHAFHTQQPQSAHNNIMLTGQDASAAAGPLPQIAGQTPAPASSQAYPGATTGAPQPNSYDIARREAALLGLNAGPGQGFPYIQKYERVRTTPHAQAAAPQPLAAQPHAAQPHAAHVPLTSGDPAMTDQPWRQAPQQQISQQPAPVPQPWQQGTANQPGAVPQPSPPGGGQLSQSAAQSPSSAPWTGAPSTTTQYYRADSPTAQPPSQVIPAPYYQQSSARPQGQAVPAAYHATQPAMSYPPQQTSNGVAVPEAYSNRPSAAAPQPSPQYPGQAHPAQVHPAQNQPTHRPYTGLTIVPGER